MTTLVLIFASALVLAIGATPVARSVAHKLGILDQPAARKVHRQPIPLLGGVAIYAAFIAALLLFGDRFYVGQTVGIVVGATWVSFLGVVDDWRGIRAYAKLAGQVIGALILVATGVQVEFLHQPILNIIITIVWVVGITNAFNLLDNMDGLSGGIAAIVAGWFLILSASNGQILVGSLSAALLGASLGFLLYNFNPASIFMGDGGSLFLGFVLAAAGIKLRFPDNLDVITWMVPVLVLAVPIFDTTLVFISRLRRGLNPLTTPGKDHVSHRLVRRGLSPRRAVMVLYAVGLVAGALAFVVSRADFVMAYAILAAVVVVGIGMVVMLEKKGL